MRQFAFTGHFLGGSRSYRIYVTSHAHMGEIEDGGHQPQHDMNTIYVCYVQIYTSTTVPTSAELNRLAFDEVMGHSSL